MALDLHVETKGDRAHPPVLLLHGLLGAARNLGRLADGLARAGFFVVSYDQRGHGRSPWAGDYTVENLAADALAVLDSQGIGAAHFVGHSLGGRVSLAVGALAPERMLSLTLLDVGPMVSEASVKEISLIIDPLPPSFPNLAEAKAFAGRYNPAIAQFMLANLKRLGPTPEGSAAPDQPLSWAFDLAGIRRFLNRGLRTDQSQNLTKLKCPTLMLRGENSKYLAAAGVAAAQALNPAIKTAEVPGAGHWLHADNPQDTLRLVTEFLRAQGE